MVRASRRRNRQARASAKEEAVIAPLPDRKLGHLSLPLDFQARKNKHLEACNLIRETAYAVIFDTDNFKRYLAAERKASLAAGQRPFDTLTLRDRVLSYLKLQNPGLTIYKGNILAVGDFSNFPPEVPKYDGWVGVIKHHIAPRNAVCCNCLDPIQTASMSNRAPVLYEKVTDIGDDKIQQLIFKHVMDFGSPCNILLGSGDGDFIRPVQLLDKVGVKVTLCMPMPVKDCSFGLRQVVVNRVSIRTIMQTPILHTN